VDGELRALWSAAPARGELPKARACTMNLVVVAGSPELASRWVSIVDDVVQGIPARAIIVGLDPDAADGLEASVSAVCTPAPGGGSATCSERVTLAVRGGVCPRMPSVVRSLCVTDVPTTLVWLGRVHADDPTFAPLAPDAGRIVLDASEGSLASLANVVYWARARGKAERPGVADLAWTRLAPWQELCARMFDEPRLRALASHVTRLTLVQASAPGKELGSEGALMLGWLATRLGWKAGALAGKLRLSRADGGALAVALQSSTADEGRSALHALRLEASHGPLSVTGEILRDQDAATWRMTVAAGADDVKRVEQHVRLRTSETARLLERTLRRPARDETLAEAVAWVDELRGEELACA
jgi:glucose-6-phosphate dehydrogenase assembly protein OpcA